MKQKIYQALYSAGNTRSWPSANEMGLDASQYDAVKLALQNKLTLIQGYYLFNFDYTN